MSNTRIPHPDEVPTPEQVIEYLNTGAVSVNPLFEAIERLTNPYAMQERVYRNRVDQDAADDIRAMAGYPNEIVTPLEVIVIRDADHLREVLDSALNACVSCGATSGHIGACASDARYGA